VLHQDQGVWISAENFRPERFSEDRREHLAHLADVHFWFDGRARLLTRILDELPLPSHAAALELGCGTGTFLPVLRERFSEVVGVDGYASSLHAAYSRAPGSVLVQADGTRVPFAPGQFDLIVALDVLEHVDPERFFAEVSRLIRPGGFLLLSVPAFPLLWSGADVRAGHRCRYRKRQLAAELRQAGWALAGSAYYQCALFAPMLFARRIGRRRTERVERTPPAWLGRMLRLVNRVEWAMLGRRAPFGTSLVAWARR
jgi:SAM-dependent methyltransferase